MCGLLVLLSDPSSVVHTCRHVLGSCKSAQAGTYLLVVARSVPCLRLPLRVLGSRSEVGG
jgi:hypothetical protein